MATFWPGITGVDDRGFGRSRQGADIKGLILHHGGGPSVRSYLIGWNERSSHSTYHVSRVNAFGIVHPDRAPSSTGWAIDQHTVSVETDNIGGAPDWPVADLSIDIIVQLVVHHARESGRLRVEVNRPGVDQGPGVFYVGWHSQYVNTTCPGNFMRARVSYIVAEANRIINEETTRMLWPNGTNTEPRRSDGYGPRESIQTDAGWTRPFHVGTDWYSIGTIRTIAAGMVIESGWLDWAGNQVLVYLGELDGIRTWVRYCHLAWPSLLSRGDQVAAGAVIGTEGATGQAAGVHLHFEVYRGRVDRGTGSDPGATVDPRAFILARLGTTLTEADMDKLNELWQRLLPGEAGKKTAGDVYLDVMARLKGLAADAARAVWDSPVQRGDKKISALQELADAKTLGQTANQKLDELLARPVSEISLTPEQMGRLAEAIGSAVALQVAPAVLDQMAKRLEA